MDTSSLDLTKLSIEEMQCHEGGWFAAVIAGMGVSMAMAYYVGYALGSHGCGCD